MRVELIHPTMHLDPTGPIRDLDSGAIKTNDDIVDRAGSLSDR